MCTLSGRSALSALLAAFGLWMHPALAGCDISGVCVFDVASTEDRRDRVLGDGVCDSPPNILGGEPGPCTLRAAVMEANARDAASSLSGPYMIHLPAGTYELTRANVDNGDADDGTGSLNVTADGVSIVGPGDGAYAVIRGSQAFAKTLIDVQGALNFHASYVELTGAEHGISCDRTTATPASTMTLDHVRLHHLVDETHQQDSGGALQGRGCQIEIADSELWANDAAARGNAIYVSQGGSLRASRVAIVGNGGNPSPNFDIKGTALHASSANVNLDNVTVAANYAEGYGAVAFWGDDTHGVYQAELRNVTIARNYGSGASGTSGLFLTYGQTNLYNAVIADNVGGDGDLLFSQYPVVSSGGYNVLGGLSAESGEYDYNLYITDRTDQHNVGLSFVPLSLPSAFGVAGLRPLPGGLLIDQGSPLPPADNSSTACQERDATNRKRKAGGRCDIGAIEYFPEPWTFHAVQLADGIDGDPGDGVCSTVALPAAPDASTCTLRAAVMESTQLHADGHPGPFVANLAPGDHELSLGSPVDDDPASGDLDIGDFHLIVRGDQPLNEDASAILAQGAGFPDRLFDVHVGGNLDIGDVALAGSSILDGGAGVRCNSADVTVERSRFRDLHATSGAAVLADDCGITITDSEFADNEVLESQASGVVEAQASTLDVVRTTFHGNHGGGSGSVIRVPNSNGDLRMADVTISGNHSAGTNTVVFVPSRASLRNVTVANNDADASAMDTGALWFDATADATLQNSIVAGNSGGSDLKIEPGAVLVESHNLIGTLTPGSAQPPESNPGQQPDVGPLVQLTDSGLAWGHIPLPGGAAHNHGNPGPGFSDDPDSPLCSRYDQSYRDRGLAPDHVCDIGAVEYFEVPPPPVDIDTIFKDDFEIF